MDIKKSLKRQYKASLNMLRECIEKCPDEAWLAGEHPRNFWRIAYHALYYTHLYMMPTEDDFVAWEKHRDDSRILWDKPAVEEAYSIEETLEYLDFVAAHVGEWVDALDLESKSTGIPWYKGMGKFEHQLVNLRHIQGHVGQLSELLMTKGIYLTWVSKA
ncbi:MAG: DinB family protein [Fimbriimonadaceae bacterium]